MENKEKLIKLCDYYTETNPPTTLRWGWGEGLIMYTLLLLDDYLNQNRYFNYVKEYADYYYDKDKMIDCSDRVSPCLATLKLFLLTKDPKYKEMTDLGIKYIKESKKIYGGIPNHFGISSDSTYPQSIWADSLVMFSWFVSLYAKTFNDKELMEYAKIQPKNFASCLQSKNGIFHHAYWVNENIKYPKHLFWGRGNGWVVLSFPMIGEITSNINELKPIYLNLVNGLIKYQTKSGAFRTIINHIESYKETSATSLFAAGIYKAIKVGLIDESYKKYADKAFDYTIKMLNIADSSVLLEGISRPTIPHAKIPYIWYMKMPRKPNYNFGIAAFILSVMYKDELENN